MKLPSFSAFLRGTGFTPTPAQAVLCRVALDGAAPGTLDGTERELALGLFGSLDTVPSLARGVVVLVKGARIGGTLLASLRLLHLALTVDLSTLAPGELAAAIIVAPDTRLARQALRYALGVVRGTVRLTGLLDGSPSKDGFTLRRPDGRRVSVECLPATRGGSALRGRSLVGVQLSEAAFFRDAESGVVNDQELFRAVAPRVLVGGQIIIESTPWLESGLLYELNRDNWEDPKTALIADCPTLVMRPDERTRAIVEDEQRRDPDNALREFGGRAGFLGGGANVMFDPVAIDKAVDESRAEVVSAPSGSMVGAGADIGLVKDSSALAIVACTDQTRFTLLQIEEQRPRKGEPLKLSAVVASFASTMRAHGVHDVAADGHAREPAREWAEKENVTISPAPEGRQGKNDVYVAFGQALREGRVNLPRHPRLLAQLRAVVARPAPGGGFIISSPRRVGGGHGDLVSALVLAAWHAQGGAGANYSAMMEAMTGADYDAFVGAGAYGLPVIR